MREIEREGDGERGGEGGRERRGGSRNDGSGREGVGHLWREEDRVR